MIARFSARQPEGDAVQQLELLVRTAIFKPANELVGWLLQQAADRIDAAYQPKPGQVRKARVKLELQGLFGCFELSRDYYYHAGKGEGHYPADAALGLAGAYTPALARLICLEGADESSYEKASTHLQELGGVAVSGRQIQRLVQRLGAVAAAWTRREAPPMACAAPVMYVSADGTGVPMRKSELQGRAGKQADGSAKTRQVYLGAVFTQHTLDAEGRPIRDHASTTYVSGLCTVEDFGLGLRREALRRGMGGAKKVVLLIDGASGLEKMGRDYFPGELQIVDFYHALEHLEEVLKLLWEKSDPQFQEKRQRWIELLLDDGLEGLIEQARGWAAARGNTQQMEKTLLYFQRNQERMRYGHFRRAGYFIGSGVIEAGCKTLVGARCKQSGMFWSVPGVENVLALRCLQHSQRTNAFWKDRLNELAAQNDLLPLAA